MHRPRRTVTLRKLYKLHGDGIFGIALLGRSYENVLRSAVAPRESASDSSLLMLLRLPHRPHRRHATLPHPTPSNMTFLNASRLVLR